MKVRAARQRKNLHHQKMIQRESGGWCLQIAKPRSSWSGLSQTLRLLPYQRFRKCLHSLNRSKINPSRATKTLKKKATAVNSNNDGALRRITHCVWNITIRVYLVWGFSDKCIIQSQRSHSVSHGLAAVAAFMSLSLWSHARCPVWRTTELLTAQFVAVSQQGCHSSDWLH